MVLELEVNVIGTNTEKNLQIFSKFRKFRAVKNQIRNNLIDNIEINNLKDINKQL